MENGFGPGLRYRYLIYVLLLLPVFILRDYLPANELKYMSIVDEALRNNTWFAFLNQGEIYSDKPPLYFWLMMLSRIVTGGYHMWLMALFNLLPAVGILAVMDRWFRREGIAFSPLMSNLLLLTTAMFLGGALILRMDMLMAFFITLSLYTFYRLYTGTAKPRERWLLPLYIFLALFSKGPMGVLIPVVSIAVFLAFKRQIKTFGRYLGWKQWGIMVGLAAVWFGLVYAEGGDDYLNSLLFKQTVGRGINAYHHKEPFWYYFVQMLWMFAPWIVIYAVAIWKGVRSKLIKNDIPLFFLSIGGSTLLMLSIISSKVEIYLLPVFPFLVYLAGAYIWQLRNDRVLKTVAAVTILPLVLAFPVSFIVLDGQIKFEYDSLAMMYIGLGILCVAGLWSLWLLRKRDLAPTMICVCAGLVLCITSLAFALPQFSRYMGLRYMAEEAMKTAEEYGVENYAYYIYYTAPNMDFYLQRPLPRLGNAAEVDSVDRSGIPTLLFVRDKELRVDEPFKQLMSGRPEAGRNYKYCWFIIGQGRDGEAEENIGAEEIGAD